MLMAVSQWFPDLLGTPNLLPLNPPITRSEPHARLCLGEAQCQEEPILSETLPPGGCGAHLLTGWHTQETNRPKSRESP